MQKFWDDIYEKLGSNFYLGMFILLLGVIIYQNKQLQQERKEYSDKLELIQSEVKNCKQDFINYFIEKETQLQQVAVQADEAITTAQTFSTKLKKIKKQQYFYSQNLTK